MILLNKTNVFRPAVIMLRWFLVDP